jgi:hypothetical protein
MLTDKQAQQLIGLATRGTVCSYPGSVSVLRALARRGLVVEIENPHATNSWTATEDGVRAVEEIERGDDYLLSLRVAYSRALAEWQQNRDRDAAARAQAIDYEIRSIENGER